ncbi:MAG: glutaredoxin 3 [Gammaproteobacteria bacterium]|nr:MAG: glutaredoxin 3 [Gammaproteobacteria bacterium]RKZ95725.1 MAG: glutaredoxin 3 [Gammaproteobacteria bacterium]RKZ97130.1 MAG: glutaredoxin 3 [Gammaproteobacteria bacterium]
MAKVEVYSSAHCPFCVMAKRLLDRKGVSYEEIRVDLDPDKRQEMMKKSRQRTVPQIFINNEAIGGYTDLVAIDNSQRLDSLLAQS